MMSTRTAIRNCHCSGGGGSGSDSGDSGGVGKSSRCTGTGAPRGISP